MGELAVVLLALFGQIERTYTLERVAHARSVAEAKGRRVGRPSTVDASKLAYAVRLRDVDGLNIDEIVTRTKIPRSSLYRHLPPRPTPAVTAAGQPDHRDTGDSPILPRARAEVASSEKLTPS